MWPEHLSILLLYFSNNASAIVMKHYHINKYIYSYIHVHIDIKKELEDSKISMVLLGLSY